MFCCQVSWLRHKDVKLLSVGTYLYTTVNKQILQIKLELVPDFFLFNFGTWSLFTFLSVLKIKMFNFLRKARNICIFLLDNYTLTFFKDPRMMVRQDLSAGEWQLIIKDVRYSDAGQYECQINTSPVLSHTLKLAVVGKCEDPWYHHLSIFPPLSWRVESALSIQYFPHYSEFFLLIFMQF